MLHIKRVQVEEGFLDGLDAELVPGLNVIIGARGTGKTSLIELIRFCLGSAGQTAESAKRSHDHAIAVLGTGQITVTLATHNREILVTRTALDRQPRSVEQYVPPIIFSQSEIEAVGLQPAGRLQLLDAFVGERRKLDAEETAATGDAKSLNAEVAALRREVDELRKQLIGLPVVEEQLANLVLAEGGLNKASADAAAKKKRLATLTTAISSASVASTGIERFRTGIKRWGGSLDAARRLVPTVEGWPSEGGKDPLHEIRQRAAKAEDHFNAAIAEVSGIESAVAELLDASAGRRLKLEEEARQLRKSIESLQAGAGAIARERQQLTERKAQLESIRQLIGQREKKLRRTADERGKALDRLEEVRERRYRSRVAIAASLGKVLGPRIRIMVERAGQFSAFAALIAELLRGSGLKYADLSVTLAEKVSPRELLEAADANDFEGISDATGVSRDRAARLLSQLRDADLGELGTVGVEDAVSLELLDGQDYKDISHLSTGQRCTVVLPLILRHTERILIVDQPEDHIDNGFIADTLIASLRARNHGEGQIIFSSHNANIPVLGNAARVLQLDSDGQRAFVRVAEPLEHPDIVSAISTLMEGGASAFKRRASFYKAHSR